MKLKTVHVREFQSIQDSTEFSTEQITCLVGKNEAGKTAVLQALYRLNPVIDQDGAYDVTDDYPRRDVEDYRQAVEDGSRQHAVVCTAVFELDASEVSSVQSELGPEALKSNRLTLFKGYENTLRFQLQLDEAAARRFIIKGAQLTPEGKTALEACSTVDAVLASLASQEQTSEQQRLTAAFAAIKKEGLAKYVYSKHIRPHVPKFLYFDEYYQMRGHENIEALMARKQQNQLKKSDYPMLGLVELSRLELQDLLNTSRTEELVNRIEGAGNHLSKQVLRYWSQNKHLQLRFDVRAGRPGDPEEMRSGTNIWGRVYDSKHMVTTPLGSRSRGFIWFFSFLAWYSQLKQSNEPMILLLDEPGLTLHGRAQEDLLRYIEEQLSSSHQVIFTTHSPFMVDAHHFERVRIVQDLSIDTDDPLPASQEGTKVLTDVLAATEDSLFPLQGALGYEIFQTLFIGPNSLVVEGASDLLYLQAMSALLQRRGRKGLSAKWTITPVGGADKVPTFVALLGAQTKLNIATLIDVQRSNRQTIENLYKRKLLKKKQVLTFADFTSSDEADIEDMFEPEFYLRLVNAEYAQALTKPIAASDLNVNLPRVLVRLEEYFAANPLKGDAAFSHYRPARYLAENVSALEGEMSEQTLERFENAFRALNQLL